MIGQPDFYANLLWRLSCPSFLLSVCWRAAFWGIGSMAR